MAARKVPLWWKVINCFLMVAYTIVGLIGAVGAFYFIDRHVNTYRVSANTCIEVALPEASASSRRSLALQFGPTLNEVLFTVL